VLESYQANVVVPLRALCVAAKSIRAPPERLKARRIDYVISSGICTSYTDAIRAFRVSMQICSPVSDFMCNKSTLRTHMANCLTKQADETQLC
jgi:hypothetical protein